MGQKLVFLYGHPAESQPSVWCVPNLYSSVCNPLLGRHKQQVINPDFATCRQVLLGENSSETTFINYSLIWWGLKNVIIFLIDTTQWDKYDNIV